MKTIKEKKERALGTRFFLKAERCNSPKCVMVRRPYRPGVHGQKRHKISDYGRQLQEKQKIQITYGLTNRQMRNSFKRYSDKAVLVLERRLDRVVFLLGFAASPRIARQFISHGHILVNDRKVTIASYLVNIGDVITIRPQSKSLIIFEGLQAKLKKQSPPAWLKLDPVKIKGECLAKPQGDDINLPFDINLVVQFYSR